MALEALLLGISVLAIDTDVVFAQNPMNVFHGYKNFDIVILQQLDKVYCSGLYFANPTEKSIYLHTKMMETINTKGGDTQNILNDLLKGIPGLKIATLNLNLFPDGLIYRKQEKCCSFANDRCCPLKDIVLFHNNIIYPKPWAKVYRFKEQLLWNVDSNR